MRLGFSKPGAWLAQHMANDFYRFLQVTREATPDEIHAAYRRRALELHPDRSGGRNEPFVELQRAYSVLRDPERRAAYDHRKRSIPIRGPTGSGVGRLRAEPFRAVEPVTGFGEVSLPRSFEHFAPSFEEIFDRLWSNFERVTRPKQETLQSLTIEFSLSADEALAGGAVCILVPALLICQTCYGHGEVGGYQCWRCLGQGTVTTEYPLNVPYPAGLRRDYLVRVPLEPFGIQNFYFTVRFRPSGY